MELAGYDGSIVFHLRRKIFFCVAPSQIFGGLPSLPFLSTSVARRPRSAAAAMPVFLALTRPCPCSRPSEGTTREKLRQAASSAEGPRSI
ncbi:hypothetical protein BS78_04G087500 [Paspalum vaginatum]|nr:hypothetical protein BS78_04G087500 [Paspalum vaginatum]